LPLVARLCAGSGAPAEQRHADHIHPSIRRNDRALLDDAPAATVLGDALRANATITSLTLDDKRLWSDRAAAVALLGALIGGAA
jgi:hypothetical protein